LEWRGYSIVREDDLKNPRYKAPGLQSDGTYMVSDVILMETREEVFQFFQQEYENRARENAEGAEAQTKSKLEEQGAPTFGVTRKR